MAGVVRNFKNTKKTIASHHQRYMCYKMTCSTDFLGKDPYGPVSYPNFKYCLYPNTRIMFQVHFVMHGHHL